MRWLLKLFLIASAPTVLGQTMTLSDVQTVMAQAVQEAKISAPNSIIAIVDREGHVLAVWDVNGGTMPPPTSVAAVVSFAGAASFLSSDEHAFTTRTAAFIIQQNFPPGVPNRPNGPLVGVNFSSMAFTDTNKYKAPLPDNSFPSPPVPGVNDLGSATPADFFRSVPFTSLALAGDPGGVPLFKNGRLVGGVGVFSGIPEPREPIQTPFIPSLNERIALSGQAGFRPAPQFDGSNVFIDGLRVAYLASTGSNNTVANPSAFLANPTNGQPVIFADIDGIPASLDNNPVDYSPKPSPATVLYPDPFGLTGINGSTGQLRSAIRADPIPGNLAGVPRLTALEVEDILRRAAERSQITRAGIRVPRGKITQVWISVINNPASPGVEPVVLGTYRTPDATIFSWDVAVQKARTALFFSRGLERGAPRAFSSRSVGFLAQSMYPPGIAGTFPGPFNGFQELWSLVNFGPNDNRVPAQPINLNVPNGITIFPGGFPLYRNGVLIGAIGVSGDGIEQDDIAAAAGTANFPPPPGSRSDDFVFQNARIPYAKFPRAATSF